MSARGGINLHGRPKVFPQSAGFSTVEHLVRFWCQPSLNRGQRLRFSGFDSGFANKISGGEHWSVGFTCMKDGMVTMENVVEVVMDFIGVNIRK
jgi:hypothetical protein